MKSSSNECFFVDFPTFMNRVDEDVDEEYDEDVDEEDVVEALEKEFSKRHGGDLEAAGEAADEDVVGDLQEAAGEVQRQARTE